MTMPPASIRRCTATALRAGGIGERRARRRRRQSRDIDVVLDRERHAPQRILRADRTAAASRLRPWRRSVGNQRNEDAGIVGGGDRRIRAIDSGDRIGAPCILGVERGNRERHWHLQTSVERLREERAARPRAARAYRRWLGAVITASVSPASTMRPPFITITRSHSSRTTCRSWLTRTDSSCRARAFRSTSRLSTTACTETSSAAVGSSRISSFGDSAMARAIPTRAFWPPES